MTSDNRVPTQANWSARAFGANRISALILYLALAGAPLFFGSREPETVAGWCALLGLGLALASPSPLAKGHLLVLGVIAAVVLCYGFVIHEQLSDRPWIAPFNPVWAKASQDAGVLFAPSVSIVRGEPFFALGAPLANVLALALGVIVGAQSGQVRKGIHVLAWAGVAYAVYGIAAFIFDPSHILWREKTAYGDSLTATFVNRNTAAAYFGSCAAIWLILLMAAVRNVLPRGPIEWKKVPHYLIVRSHKTVLVRFIMFFVCLSALFMTSSRGGTLLSMLVMIACFMIYFGRDLSRGKGLVLALCGCVLVGLLMLQILGSNIGGRIETLGLSDAGRLAAYRSTLNIIADNPWFGTGLGTFALRFPAYRSGDISMQGLWGIAHNTHLELASEVGVPLALIVAAAWIAALVVLTQALFAYRRGVSVPLSAFAVSLIALSHSSIDFSLQVAGYSIVVFALLGLGLGYCMRRPRRFEAKQRAAIGTRTR